MFFFLVLFYVFYEGCIGANSTVEFWRCGCRFSFSYFLPLVYFLTCYYLSLVCCKTYSHFATIERKTDNILISEVDQCDQGAATQLIVNLHCNRKQIQIVPLCEFLVLLRNDANGFVCCCTNTECRNAAFSLDGCNVSGCGRKM